MIKIPIADCTKIETKYLKNLLEDDHTSSFIMQSRNRENVTLID